MAKIVLKGTNGTLSYSGTRGSQSISVRVVTLAENYGVVSEESQAYATKAFYPHRRAPGQFHVGIQSIGYGEFKQLQTWLSTYSNEITAVRNTNKQPPAMYIEVASRDFYRLGFLADGLSDQDHIGSMVFESDLNFIEVADRNDSVISVLNTSQASTFSGPQVDPAISVSFYPSSNAAFKDTLLYDDLSYIDPRAAVVTAIAGDVGDSTSRSTIGGRQVI